MFSVVKVMFLLKRFNVVAQLQGRPQLKPHVLYHHVKLEQ